MANDLVNALRRKLVAYETAGMTDQAKAVKSKLVVAEKAVAKADKKAEAAAEPDADDEPTSKASKKEST